RRRDAGLRRSRPDALRGTAGNRPRSARGDASYRLWTARSCKGMLSLSSRSWLQWFVLSSTNPFPDCWARRPALKKSLRQAVEGARGLEAPDELLQARLEHRALR